jgi:hypothetical protein
MLRGVDNEELSGVNSSGMPTARLRLSNVCIASRNCPKAQLVVSSGGVQPCLSPVNDPCTTMPRQYSYGYRYGN